MKESKANTYIVHQAVDTAVELREPVYDWLSWLEDRHDVIIEYPNGELHGED